jgi:hypothetical protein
MTLSLGQRYLKLPENGTYGAIFPFEEPQPVPKTNDLSFSRSVHFGSLRVIALM